MVKVKDKGVIVPTGTTKFLVSESDAGEVKQSELQNMGAGIKLDDLATPDDTTDLDVSTTAHGLTPKLPNDSTRYLNGLGQWTIPLGGGGGTGLPQGYAVIDSTYPANDSLTRTYKDFEVAVSTEPENTTFVFMQDGQTFSPATPVTLKFGQKFVCSFLPSSGIVIILNNDFESTAIVSSILGRDTSNEIGVGVFFSIESAITFHLAASESTIYLSQKVAATSMLLITYDSEVTSYVDTTAASVNLGDYEVIAENSKFHMYLNNDNAAYYDNLKITYNGSTHRNSEAGDIFSPIILGDHQNIVVGADPYLSAETTQYVDNLEIYIDSGIVNEIAAMANNVFVACNANLITSTFETGSIYVSCGNSGIIGDVYVLYKDFQGGDTLVSTSFCSVSNDGTIKNIDIEKSDYLIAPSANKHSALMYVASTGNSYTKFTPYIMQDAAFNQTNFPLMAKSAVLFADVEGSAVVELSEVEIHSDLYHESPVYFLFTPLSESLGMGEAKPKLIINGSVSGLTMDWGTSVVGTIPEKALVHSSAVFGTYEMPVSIVVDNLTIQRSGGSDAQARDVYIYKNALDPDRAKYVDLETKKITLDMDYTDVYICEAIDSRVKTQCYDNIKSNNRLFIVGDRSIYQFFGKNEGDFNTQNPNGKLVIENLIQDTVANVLINNSNTVINNSVVNNLTVGESADNCIGYGNIIGGTYTNVDGVNNKFLEYTNVGGEINPATTLLDEDDFASNSDTQAPTQQSTKAYVDNNEGRVQQLIVANNSGATIAKGKVVTGSGYSGGLPEIVLADASVFEKSRMIGVVLEDILDGATGTIYLFGEITGLDTSALSVGPVYLTTEGNLSSTAPSGGFYYAIIGFVGVSDAVNGFLFVNVLNLELAQEITSTNGFPEDQRTDTTLTYTDLTRTIEIAPTGTQFHFYQAGVKFIKEAADSYILPDLEGPHLVYYDNGALTSLHNPTDTQSIDVIKTKCLVTDIYWDSTNQEFIYKGDARHGISMSPVTHAYLNITQGTKYVSGLGVTNTDTSGDGSLDAHAQFGIAEGVIIDEDLLTNISTVVSTTGLPIYYYEGALGFLRRQFNSGFAVLTTGTGRLAWNENTGSTYQLTECANNTFVCCHVFASGAIEYPIISFAGLVNYASLSEAQEGAKTEIVEVMERTVKSELAPIATFIFQTENSFTNAVKAKLVEVEIGSDYVDFRVATIGATGGSANHNTLPGLELAGAGVTFGHINDQAQTLAGEKTFSTFPKTPSAEPTDDYEVINKKFFNDWNGLDVNIPVYNQTGSTITRGKVCYANGYFNDLSTIDLADATVYEKSRYLVVANEDILTGTIGRVKAFGKITDIDTSGYGSTGTLYLTTNGDMSTTRPTGGSFIGHVGKASVVDAVNGVLYIDPQVSYDTVEELGTNGFPDSQRFEAVLSYDNPTRTVTVTPAGASYHYYQDGVKYIQTTPQSITVGVAEEGPHAIYFDGATLTDFYNPTPQQYNELIKTKCLVTGVNFDTTNQVFNYLADHRYGISMSPATHVYLSSTKGTQYTGGLDLNTFSVGGDGSSNLHAQFGHDAGTTINKDIQYDIGAVLSAVGLPVYHFETALGLLRREINAGFSVVTTGTGRLAWNESVGGAYQVSEAANNSYVLCHIAATASVEYPLNTFMGLSNHLSLTDAKNAAKTEIYDVELMLTRTEVIPLATVILETSDTFTNSVKARVIEISPGVNYQDFKVEADVGDVPDHNALLNVALADTGVTYGHISDQTQTLYGVKTLDSFMETPSSAPTTDYQVSNKKYVDDSVFPLNQIVADRNEPNGFVDESDVLVSFNDGLRRLTIQPAAVDFSFYSGGTKYTKSAAETIDISTDEGRHYIYYDGATISETTTFDDRLIEEWAFIAAIYWDATNSKQIYFAREYKHGVVMDSYTHYYLHNSRGYQLISGGALGNLLTDQDGSLDTHAQVANEESVCYDEDARHVLAARTSSTTIPVYYRDGAEASNLWRIDETDSFPLVSAGTGRAGYNELSGGFWAVTEVTNGNFLLAHIAATNDSDRPFVAYMGTSEYTNIEDARNGALTEIRNILIDGLSGLEFKFLGTLIIQTSDSYTNTPKSRFLSTNDGSDYVDFRGTQLAANKGTAEITDHNTLANLQGGAVSEYYHITSTQESDIVANTAARHDAVTVLDTATVDLTLTGQQIQAAVIPAGVDHESLGGLLGGAASDHYHLTSAQQTKVTSVTGDIVGTTDTQTLTNKTMSFASNTFTNFPCEIGVVCSNEVDAITVGVSKSSFRMPYAMTVTEVRASARTAPTGANLVIDINESGTTILSTKLSIDAGENTSTTATTPAVISDSTLADDAEITIDFDQIGSTLSGAGIKIWLIGTRV